MNTARRWYIYLVCAISLQSVTWAVIALLRNLLAGGGGQITYIAFQIAVIVIALPVFLVHWLWAQRLAKQDTSERESGLRGFYHYGMMIGFLGPVVANAYTLISSLLWLATGKPGYDPFYTYSSSPFEWILYDLIAIIICGLLWFYQKRIVAEDVNAVGEHDNFSSMSRLYMFVFSAWGLWMTILAVIHIIRWMMYQFGSTGISSAWGLEQLINEIARLIIGTTLWIVFWRKAQALFNSISDSEHESALRKFYLYAVVFVAALSVVTNATFILAGFFRRLLSLPSEGDIRTPLPSLIGMLLLWIYHSYQLKADATKHTESSKQGGVRRLYLYLIAGIGLAAFLIGLSGDLSTFIRSFSETFDTSLKEGLAWFTATLLAGLPVWLFSWRNAQLEAVALTTEGAEARRSTARKIYLYFYLFIATMAVLSSAVYILYRILLLVLGEPAKGDLLSGIAQAIAYALVGIGVWLYHGYALRGDGKVSRRERALRLQDMRVTIVTDEMNFGQVLLNQLKKEEPDLKFDLVSLPIEEGNKQSVIMQINQSGLIIGPWSVAVDKGLLESSIAQAVVKSSAHKLLLPVFQQGWDWVGVDRWNVEALIQQTVKSVKQWIDGDEVKATRPISVGGVIGTIVGVVFLLILLLILTIFIIDFF